ncbi:MAG TPA: YerC/YecD family TrpR-related protein [Candidatus Saccharimonadales bacterium]|nr:YerC/YecD family TrpR-related protein [Candidatus Saccharimonadales bacterium]
MSYEIEPQLKTKACRELYRALAGVKRSDHAAKLLRDILTFEEIEEAARRLQVARLLDQGTTFRAIADRTSMSTATISRINYWLHHGTGGYRLALGRLSGGHSAKT